MPVRATKRGAERTPLDADADVLICGASFAGLSVARELAGSGARVLVVDRYEIGERQTSACAAPTQWLRNLSLEGSIRQTFGDLVVHTVRSTIRYDLPWTFSTFDYRELCALLAQQGDFTFETAKVESIDRGAAPPRHHRSRRAARAARRRRAGVAAGARARHAHPAARGAPVARPGGPSRRRGGRPRAVDRPRGHPLGLRLELPGGRRGARRRRARSTPPTTSRSRRSRWPRSSTCRRSATRATGSPTSCARPIAEDVFFAGDSAGHCLPLTAEGIRTAFYFGLAAGREIRAVVDGTRTRAQALEAYGAFSAAHARPYRWLLNFQHCVGPMNERGLVDPVMRLVNRRWWVHAFFNRYLAVAPPEFAGAPPAARQTPAALAR